MQENTFDRVSRRLGATTSRRQMLGGLFGSTAVALVGVALTGDAVVAAKKGGKGKSKGRGKGVTKGVGKGSGIGQGNSGGNAGGNGNGKGNGGTGPSKVSFCHANEDGTYELVTVAAPAAHTRAKHGDVQCAQVVVVPECNVGTCSVDTVSGTATCGYAPATSAEPITCGTAGTCDQTAGTCLEPTTP